MKKLIVILFIGCSSVFAQFPVWQERGEMPIPVAGAASITDKGNIYIFGGYSSSTQNFVDYIQKYSTHLSIWKLSEHMMNPRFGFWAGIENDTVYYFGGLDDTISNSNSLELWNIGNPTLTLDTNKIFDRVFSSAVIDSNRILIFGGNSSAIIGAQKTPYIVEYSIAGKDIRYQNDSLYSDGDLPEQQMIVKKGNFIYIFGGVINGVSNRIFKFDVTTHSFERLPVNLLEPRAGGRAVLNYSTGEIYIIGGYNENNPAMSSVEIFYYSDGSGFNIYPGPALITGRCFPIAEYVNEFMFVMGGYNDSNDPEPTIEALYSVPTIIEGLNPPNKFTLLQNYPNPFNPETNIAFNVVHSEYVSLEIFNNLGEKVKTLLRSDIDPGRHNLKWNGKNDADVEMPSGMYLLKLTTRAFSDSKKMILLR